MNSNEITETIRLRRKNLGLTQVELADLADVSERLIRDLEAGRLTVGTDKLLATLDALGMGLLGLPDARVSKRPHHRHTSVDIPTTLKERRRSL